MSVDLLPKNWISHREADHLFDAVTQGCGEQAVTTRHKGSDPNTNVETKTYNFRALPTNPKK